MLDLNRTSRVESAPAPTLVPPQVALADALDRLVIEFGLRSAVLRTDHAVSGLLALAGEVVDALPQMRSHAPSGRPSLELPVLGTAGAGLATLVVVGARPDQLPALRSSAALLGLALTGLAATGAQTRLTDDDVRGLVDDNEQSYDDLAAILHDDAVQALVAARYLCDAAVRAGAVRAGDGALARESVQGALVTLRRTLWQLRSRGVGRGDLPGALEALSAHLVEQGHAPLRLDVHADAAVRLGGAAGVTAYRLVQSASRPGSGDRPVEVTLRHDGADGLVLEVAGGQAGSALQRWQRRAEAVGGWLNRSGTGVRLHLPSAALPVSPAPAGPTRVSPQRVRVERVSAVPVSPRPFQPFPTASSTEVSS